MRANAVNEDLAGTERGECGCRCCGSRAAMWGERAEPTSGTGSATPKAVAATLCCHHAPHRVYSRTHRCASPVRHGQHEEQKKRDQLKRERRRVSKVCERSAGERSILCTTSADFPCTSAGAVQLVPRRRSHMHPPPVYTTGPHTRRASRSHSVAEVLFI